MFPSTESLLEEAPGIILGVWKGSKCVVNIEAVGERSIVTHKPMCKTLHVRIGSITKCFTSVVIFKLIENGYIGMDDYANLYLPEIPKDITIRQLGNMTSGLYNYTDSVEFRNKIDKNPSYSWSPEELLQIGLSGKSYFSPGKGWYYSNTNYIALGLIAEKVTGRSMESMYKEYIFDPLGLNDTYIPSGTDIRRPFSHGYMYGYNNPENGPEGVFRDVTEINPSYASFAGYIISTLEDLRKFSYPFSSGSLIGGNMKKLRDTTFIGTRFGQYGFGIAQVESSTQNGKDGWYGHNGTISGFQNVMYTSLCCKHTVIILTNLQRTLLGGEPASSISGKIIDIINEKCR